jgi:nucleoside-diphosphate-sugar epimerase
MQRILVTGGAGYVGTSLIPQLLERQYHVRVLDNLMFGGDQLLPFFANKRFEFTKGDVRNAQDVREAVTGCDVVIHLAAIVGYPACRKDPTLAEEVNVRGTKNIASAVSRDQLVLFGSTGSNYGAVEEICTEETPLTPLSLYGQTKTLAEADLLEHCSTIAFRFATAFGLSPRLRLDLLINDFTYRAVTQQYLVVYEKNFMRTFIHVSDMGRAFLFGLDNASKMTGQVFNVGADKMNFSKEQICRLIESQVKCYVHYAEVGEDADKRNYSVSYDRVGKLGFDTTISVEDGIAELIRGFQVLRFHNPYANA